MLSSKYFNNTIKTLNSIIKRNFSNKIANVEVIDFHSELINPKADLSDKIQKSFGSKGIGLLVVKNVPEYTKLRMVNKN
jgi:disulfide oxidoreductase YuzD